MTADTITESRVATLYVILDAARDTLHSVYADIRSGEISPEEAAAIINETIQTINSCAQ